MSDLEALRDDMLDLWRKQSAVNHALAAEIDGLHRELAEIRDGLVALSNRIEAVTRAAQREPVRPLIQSVPRPVTRADLARDTMRPEPS